jgi:MHS family alpha-ketoglutarate permease-like MFS transporter
MTNAIGRAPDLSQTTSTTPDTVGSQRLTGAQKKAVVAATLGTIVEYTDWVIYATFASILAREYFPAGDPLSALLSVFAVFAVGFVMRPVGGAVLGAFADRYGRKAGLTISILLMSIASLIIGLCPGYETIGIAAPIILVFARLVQGFSAGGEFGSASTFLVESAPANKRGFAGSWQWFAINAGTLVSFVLGYALAVLGSDSGLTDWGWRVAFVIAALLGLITLWIRLSVRETEVFTKRVASEGVPKNPVRDVLFNHRKDALRVIGIAMAGNLLNYIWMVSYPSYIHLVTDMPVRDTLLVGVISVTISLFLIPFVGLLSDKIGRKPVLLTFALASAAWTWPSFALLQPGMTLFQATAMMTTSMIIMTGFAGAGAAMMAEQFPARVRVTGVALPYALSVTLFGGTAPYITTAMNGGGYGSYVWVYPAVVCLVAAVVYARLPETKGLPLR